MTFKQATDLLTRAPTYSVARLAEVFDRSPNLVNRWRAEHGHARNPPPDWHATVAGEALKHADELEAHAAKLRRLAAELRTP